MRARRRAISPVLETASQRRCRDDASRLERSSQLVTDIVTLPLGGAKRNSQAGVSLFTVSGSRALLMRGIGGPTLRRVAGFEGGPAWLCRDIARFSVLSRLT